MITTESIVESKDYVSCGFCFVMVGQFPLLESYYGVRGCAVSLSGLHCARFVRHNIRRLSARAGSFSGSLRRSQNVGQNVGRRAPDNTLYKMDGVCVK